MHTYLCRTLCCNCHTAVNGHSYEAMLSDVSHTVFAAFRCHCHIPGALTWHRYEVLKFKMNDCDLWCVSVCAAVHGLGESLSAAVTQCASRHQPSNWTLRSATSVSSCRSRPYVIALLLKFKLPYSLYGLQIDWLILSTGGVCMLPGIERYSS